MIKRIKNALIYYIVRVLMGFFGLLPLAVARFVGNGVGRLAYFLAHRERKRAEENIRRSSLAMVHDPRQLTRDMFVQLGLSAMECVVMHRCKPHVTFAPGAREILQDAVSKKKGVVYVTAHIGNWELMAAEVAQIAPVSVFFKPSYDPRFTKMIERFRLAHGVRGISVTQSSHLRKAVTALKRGEILGILLDQPVSRGYQLCFLGREATTSPIVASLARMSGAVVVFGFICRLSPCQHAIFVHPFECDLAPQHSKKVTESLSKSIESAIIAFPEQWIWSLDRWRSTESSSLSRVIANSIPASNN